MRTWDINIDTPISSPMLHRDKVNGANLFANDSKILTWSKSGYINIWDRESGSLIKSFKAHEKEIKGATLFGKESLLLTWSMDGTARISDVNSGLQVGKLMLHNDWVIKSVLFAKDSKILTWSWDGTARVWDATSGNAISKPMQHDKDVMGAILFADESKVLTWSSDDTARVWDITSGEPISHPYPHKNLLGASLSPDESQILLYGENFARSWKLPSLLALEESNYPNEIKLSIKSGMYIDSRDQILFLTEKQISLCEKEYDPYKKCEASSNLSCKFKTTLWWPAKRYFDQLPSIEDCLNSNKDEPNQGLPNSVTTIKH